MQQHRIEITESDAKYLWELLACLAVRPGADQDTRELLRHKLDRAYIVPPNHVGGRVVTLQSRAVVKDDDTWESTTYTLVDPGHADHDAARLSILTPMGIALLGRREGDFVEWDVLGGTARVWIQKVLYQPEAAGHEHLKYSVRRTDSVPRAESEMQQIGGKSHADTNW